MKPQLIDTHAHMDMPEFDRDRNEVIARALAAGVSRMITVGIDVKSSEKAAELAESRPEIKATVGIHPHEAAWVTRADIAKLKELAARPEVVAIGEMGLDYYRHRSPRDAQQRVLQWQLQLAAELNLPVVIHCRQADADMIKVLGEWTASLHPVKAGGVGVIHCFNGDRQTAHKYLDMGFFIAFGAYIGYPTSVHLHDAIRSVPPDRYVIETDCPFLPPQVYRGKRNEPSYVAITVGVLAEIRHISFDTVALETSQNAQQLFRF